MGSKKNKAFRVHRDGTVLVAVATRQVTNDDLAEVYWRILRKWRRRPAHGVLLDFRHAAIVPCLSQSLANPLIAGVLPMRVVYLVPSSLVDWFKAGPCASASKTGLKRVVIDDATAAYEAASAWDELVAKDRAEQVLQHVFLRHSAHRADALSAAAQTLLQTNLRPPAS